MDALLAAPPSPLGLQVFVPDLPLKAANLAENLRENRTRLVQAVLLAR
jgi:sarcosine/dimethylglycine N-methyltransferase